MNLSRALGFEAAEVVPIPLAGIDALLVTRSIADVTGKTGSCRTPAVGCALDQGSNRQRELFRAHAFEYACARNDIDPRTTKARFDAPRRFWRRAQPMKAGLADRQVNV